MPAGRRRAKHARVGLPQHLEPDTGCGFEAGGQRAAVRQPGGLVGRAERVRVGGETGNALFQKPGGTAEPFVDQFAVESDDHRLRRAFVELESRRFEGRADARHPEQKNPPDFRMIAFQEIDRVVG